MELHSIKEKQSKSKRTGGCPLKWTNEVTNTESAKRCVASERRVLCMLQVC